MRQQIATSYGKSIVIAKSDLIILVVSGTLLGAAIYRWDQNTRHVDTSTVLANTRVEAPTADNGSTIDSTITLTASNTNGNDSAGLTTDTQVIIETPTVASVVVEEPAEEDTGRPYLIHVVRSGDSLSEIAARYNTSVTALRDANGINGSTIYIGQEILYPAN